MKLTSERLTPSKLASKDAAAVLQFLQYLHAQNNHDRSVTWPVCHDEMWPYARMAAARSENQSATASRIETS